MFWAILQDYPDLLFVTQVAEALQTNKSVVYRWIRDKRLPAIRIGRYYRVPRTKLIEFLDRETGGP